MVVLRDIIITGLLLGGIYALVSVGLSLQYGVGRVLNVAHGEFIMLGAFITFWLSGSTIQMNPLVTIVDHGAHGLRDRLAAARDPVPPSYAYLALTRHLRGQVDAGLVRASVCRAERSPHDLGLSDLPGARI